MRSLTEVQKATKAMPAQPNAPAFAGPGVPQHPALAHAGLVGPPPLPAQVLAVVADVLRGAARADAVRPHVVVKHACGEGQTQSEF